MKKSLLMMAVALTAMSASAQLYVTGGDVTGAPAAWAPSTPLEVQAANGEYTFEAKGEFKISLAKGEWTDFNNAAYTLAGGWTANETTATANLKQGEVNITPAKAGVAITYVVKDDLSTITAQLPTGPVTLDFYVTGAFADWQAAPADYKMTSKGNNVYSFTATNGLPLGSATAGAGFKITDGSSWYGCDGTAALNTTLNASTSAQANFEVEVPAGSEITFTYVEGGQSTVYINSNGVTPPRPVDAPAQLYVVGSLAGSMWDPATAVLMTKNDNVFTATNIELVGDANFSFLTAQSWDEARYGGLVDNEDVTFDGDVATVAIVSGANAIKAVPGLYNMTLTFAAEGNTLKLEKAGEIVVVEDLVLAGDFNGWAENDPAFKMTKDGNTYTYRMDVIAAETQFKVKTAEAEWKTSWGAEGDPSWTEAQPVAVVPNVAMNAWPGSGCNFLVENALTNVVITFVKSDDAAVASTLTVQGQSAIETVEAAATEAPAQYYNLQGIRVLAPEAGQLYIVNRAGKVSKEIAR